MTRKEQIKEVAGAYAIDEVKDTCNPASKRGLLYAGFVDGAEWADRTMIGKACEWLHTALYLDHEHSIEHRYATLEELLNDFRKAMEGE